MPVGFVTTTVLDEPSPSALAARNAGPAGGIEGETEGDTDGLNEGESDGLLIVDGRSSEQVVPSATPTVSVTSSARS